MEHGTSRLLALPIELRDLIFEYALTDDGCHQADEHTSPSNARIKRQTTGNERWEWSIHYASTAPPSAYLSLLSCNRQLKSELEDFIYRPSYKPPPAELLLVMAYPNLYSSWHHIPGPPETTKRLDIFIKADHMYHPAFMSNGPHNAILTTVFSTLKRYIHRGPHLARPSPLDQPLILDTVKVTLAPPMPFEEMMHVYGFPAQQLEILYEEFRGLMKRLCRSGLVWPDITAFELSLVGKEDESERVLVTSNVWDEEDYVFFQSGGYCWDAEEVNAS
jgi:hypothetical protein